ncbi:MAG: glycogen/starch synthase [Bacteroidales bacterium]|nr:glycogen/starch synthase [Bacteroidales bacterium]MDE6802288.1 glycogen/starch synthase [Muribaculaceae bacterium]MDE6831313.1 glycogen/starch synthase [Muribaculaceae bacterium]
MGKRILYISQEITPYLPATPMSLIGQQLPQFMQDNGDEVRIFMPKYGCINERRNQLHEVIRLSGMNVSIDDTDHPLIIKVATLQPSRMQVYFIDSDDYFVHKAVNDLEINYMPEENDERLIFFAYGVIETVKKLRWEPALIHCHGWISALAPLFLKTLYADDPMFRNSKIVYSIYNDKFEGALNPKLIDKLIENGFAPELLKTLNAENIDHGNLSRLGIEYADAVVVASEDVDPELIEYAKSLEKPVLTIDNSVEGYEQYLKFYNEQLS